MRDILPIQLLGRGIQHAFGIRARLRNRSDEVERRVRRRRRARLAVERGVENQDLISDLRVCEGVADAFQDQGRYDGSVQRADAVDDRLCVGEGIEYCGVGREPDLLAVRVDVPEALDAGGEVFFVCLGEGDVLLAQRGERAGEVGVFDAVVFFNFIEGGGRGGKGGIQGGGVRGVGDGILACYGGAVGQADGDVVREVSVDCGED